MRAPAQARWSHETVWDLLQNPAYKGEAAFGKTRHSNVWFKRILVDTAQAAAKTKNTYLAAQCRRISVRRGTKRALIAVGHSVLVIVYQMLTRHTPYSDLGGHYFDERGREHVQHRLIHRLERLGYAVTLDVVPPIS